MTRAIVLGAMLLSPLLGGCRTDRVLAGRELALPIAEETEVVCWCRRDDGKRVKCTVEIVPGDAWVPQELLQLRVTPAPETKL